MGLLTLDCIVVCCKKVVSKGNKETCRMFT